MCRTRQYLFFAPTFFAVSDIFSILVAAYPAETRKVPQTEAPFKLEKERGKT